MEQTISSLNGKAWYRFLKVVCIFLFLFVTVVTIALISDIYRAEQFNDYRVVCNYGNKTNFLARSDKGILLSDYDLREGFASIPDYEKGALLEACRTTETEEQTGFVPKLGTPVPPTSLTLEEMRQRQSSQYTFSKEQVTSGGFMVILGYSLLAILIIALVFEIARRVFYYIVLGSLRPEK